MRRRRGRQAAGAGKGAALEVGDGADRWAPPVGGYVREREGRRAERAVWAGNGELGRGRKKGEGVGRGVKLGCVVLFFSIFFKSFFKPNFKPF
jgi:hypothetical protein